MDNKDQLISEYFAQLPERSISSQFADRLVVLGVKSKIERDEVRVDRGGIWIAVVSTVVLIVAAIAIFQFFGVDFSQMWDSVKGDREAISGEAVSSFILWSVLGILALAMLIAYTLLVRHHTSQGENCGQ